MAIPDGPHAADEITGGRQNTKVVLLIAKLFQIVAMG